MRQRVIRKVETPTDESFEEQLWPVQIGLCVLGGFLAGIVLSLCRFDATPWFARPWPWLIAIGLIVGLLLLFVRKIPAAYMRRAVVLAIVLSLIANSAILIGMAWTKIFAFPGVRQRQVTQQERQSKPVVIPEYVMQPIQQPRDNRRDVDRLVETGSAKAVETDLSRQATRELDREVSPSARHKTDEGSTEMSHPRIQREVIESTPRRGEGPSLLSRRTVTRTLPGSQQARVVNQDRQPIQRVLPTPENVEIARSTPTMDGTKPPTPVTAEESSEPTRSARLARRADDASDHAKPANAPQYPQRIRRPRAAPQTNLVANAEPAASRQTNETEVKPRRTDLKRSVTAVTEANRSARTTEPRPSMRPALRRAERVAERDSESASTLRSVRERRSVLTSKPTVNTLVETVRTTSTTEPVERPDSRPTDDVAKRPARRNEVQRRVVPWPTESLSGAQQLAASKRAESESEVASMLNRDNFTPNPSRTARMAQAPTSWTAEISPAVAINESSTQDAAAEPARTAIERSTGGIAGTGGTPNLERGANASVGQADLAAAFAKRQTSTQTEDQGMAISPSTPTRERSTQSGKNAPSTSLHAQQLAVASTRGSEQTEQATATAAATIEKSAASAELAEATKARGDTQIDLGPKRIVRMDQVGRASGGGQPSLNVQTQSRLMTRSRVGGVRRISLQADIAAQVAAPADGAGQQPTVLEANPDASSVVQTDAGGSSDVSRGESGGTDVAAPSAATTAEIGVTQASRADSIEAPLSDPTSGGGKRSRRLSSKSALTARTRKKIPTVAAADDSAGREVAEDITATGIAASAIGGGLLDVPQNTEVGALADRELRSGQGNDADTPLAAESTGQRADVAEGDLDGWVSITQSSPRRSRVILPTTRSAQLAITPVDDQVGGRAAAETDGSLAAGGPSSAATLTTPRDNGARSFNREAPPGVGGAGGRIVASAGVNSPRAQTRSEQAQLRDVRFIRKNVGGPPSTVVRSAIAVDAFQNRKSRPRTMERRGSNETSGGVPVPPKTEEAIELGLVYLARQQQADGRWRLKTSTRDSIPDPKPMLESDTAATGLSLLSFLGAGYHHLDDKYASSVRAGLEFLVENQASDGNLYVRGDAISASCVGLYSHGVAALTLCEAYGMTQDEWLRVPAQKALDFIAASQNKRLGGWRYAPGIASDTSVSGWMIMALKSGELSQLNVSQETYRNTAKWLNRSQASDAERHLYRYNPLAPDTQGQRHGRQPTHVMTSVGLLMRMYLGWRRDNEWMQRGGDYLADNGPQMGTSGTARRDTYYWYYATQVMFHMGGDHWKRWNDQLHPLLVDEQIQAGPLAGSWNPFAPVPDRWAPHAGRLYVTALNLLSLEVYYRHLPIYAETAR